MSKNCCRRVSSRADHLGAGAVVYHPPSLAIRRTALLAAPLALALAAAPAAGAARTLAWSPPKMTGATTIHITPDRDWYDLDPTKDFVLKLPSAGYAQGGLTINGGRNVTLIGGHIWVPETSSTELKPRRGLLLVNQRGILHVEGLRIDGPGLSEGIQMGEPYGATVHLENIYIAHVRARDRSDFTDNHPDLVQTWAGPKRLLIDGLTGTTDLGGLTLEPTSALCYSGGCRPSTVKHRTWDFRNVDITGTDSARILLWKGSTFPISQHNIWARQQSGRSVRSSVWPNLGVWYGLHWGTPEKRMVARTSVGSSYARAPRYRW
jgi:hypothetical protein